MKTLRLTFLTLALGAVGCADTVMTIDGSEELDIERVSDPESAEEAALRASAKYDGEFRHAAEEFGVPMAVLKSLAFVQTRYEMVAGDEEFEGRPAAFGVMGVAADQVDAAAALLGVTADAIKTDALQNVRAAAALLDQHANAMRLERTEVSAWAPALAEFSKIESPEARASFVRDEVFETMKLGVGDPSVELRARGESLDLKSEFGALTQALSVAPDYSRGVWRASPNYGSRGYGFKPSLVIIHTCEGSYSGCWGWLTNSKAGVSAHYVVNPTGSEISQLVRESNAAWHIGASYNCNLNGGVQCAKNGYNVNHFSVGIEHAGYAKQSSWATGLIDASARLTCDITKSQGIVRDRFHIVGHGKLQPYNRTDPGPNWPWSTYISKVNSACSTASTPPPSTGTGTTTTGQIVIDSNNGSNDKNKGYIQVSANWTSSASTSGYYGTGYWYANTAPVSDGATFWFYLPSAQTRTIDAWWTAGTNRAAAAPFVAFNAQGTKLGTVNANQTINGKKWNAVGTYKFTAGWNKVVLSRWTADGKVVIADALRVR